jgi:Uma2 family endonuclease
MSTISSDEVFPSITLPTQWSWADVQRHVGNVPLERIRFYPPAGLATETDMLEIRDREDRLYELVDGVLVEKAMGTYESLLAVALQSLLDAYLSRNPIGVVSGEGGPLRILPARTRIPDVAVVLWERFPNRVLPRDAVFRVTPDLAVEILSAGNTADEMRIKLEEYRGAGVRLVWYIDPEMRIATVHKLDGSSETLDVNGILDGGDVLPGFSFRLRDLLDRFPREPSEPDAESA